MEIVFEKDNGSILLFFRSQGKYTKVPLKYNFIVIVASKIN
jgi:hypothetical protein